MRRFLAAIALALGCVPMAAHGEQSTIEFRNLTFPSRFFVEISVDGSVRWHTSIDAGGSGYLCPESSEYYCLVLEGSWKFAIPRRLIANPKIGEVWKFDGTDFQLAEIVWLRTDSESSLVVKSAQSKEEITFTFSAVDGIQALSLLIPVDINSSTVEPSVWINTALIGRHE